MYTEENQKKDFLETTKEAQETKENLNNKEILTRTSRRVNKQISIENILNHSKNYRILPQTKPSNDLIRGLGEMRKTEGFQLDLLGNGTYEKKDFILHIEGYADLKGGIAKTAAILLDALLIKATTQGLQETLIRLPLNEYMEMRGLKDKKSVREQFTRDVQVLKKITFKYKSMGKNKWLTIHIFGGEYGQVENGDILFRFSEGYYNCLKIGNKTQFMYAPIELLKGNVNNNPYKYWFMRRIAEHKRMNIGKNNENIISTKTLINDCPDFPDYHKENTKKRFSQIILDPFERDLDSLNSVFSWYFKDLEANPINYQEFIESKIIITWHNYPDMTELIKKRAKTAKDKEKTAKEIQKWINNLNKQRT